jgi:hypothetical protein
MLIILGYFLIKKSSKKTYFCNSASLATIHPSLKYKKIKFFVQSSKVGMLIKLKNASSI